MCTGKATNSGQILQKGDPRLCYASIKANQTTREYQPWTSSAKKKGSLRPGTGLEYALGSCYRVAQTLIRLIPEPHVAVTQSIDVIRKLI